MKTPFRLLTAALLAICLPVGAAAALPEIQPDQSLEDLQAELRDAYNSLSQRSDSIQKMVAEQHDRLAEMIKQCNRQSVQLYSQAQENTFDLSYILNQVTEQYRRFQSERLPFDEITASLKLEQDRYRRLALTLELESADSLSAPVRDSCLFYAREMMNFFGQQMDQVQEDMAYFERTDQQLKSAHDYAQERFQALQHKVFVKGQRPYFHTLQRLPRYFSRALSDIRRGSLRGGLGLAYSLGMLLLLLTVIVASLRARLDRKQTLKALSAYLPTLLLTFFIIFLRAVFAPNSVINLLVPALALLFCIWQILANARMRRKLPREDSSLLWVSAVMMGAGTILAWWGWVMSALLLLVWWVFELTLLETIMALSKLLERHYGIWLKARQQRYRQDNPDMPLGKWKGSYIEITWLQDLYDMTLRPLFYLWSVPIAVFMACRVFDFSGAARDIFFGPLIQVEGYLHLSLFKLILVISLYFVFRYLSYALKAFYRVWKTRAAVAKLEGKVAFKETDINFNLANNILSLLVWGIYIILIFVLLKIPTSALTIITTGLATGIGFAMRDILNNFFYGIQLMGGRVRVGDKVECDGVRGTVASLSYQSTQIEANDGSIIVFTNTALFNKNFKNLTRNHSYEMLKIVVGVKYGTDVEKAREVILQALEPLMVKDKYGREIVDKKKGIAVRLDEFADSSVNLQVLLHTTVDTHYSFAAEAREAIYNAFAQNGIEIPFPQRDVYIKQAPEQ